MNAERLGGLKNAGNTDNEEKRGKNPGLPGKIADYAYTLQLLHRLKERNWLTMKCYAIKQSLFLLNQNDTMQTLWKMLLFHYRRQKA